MQTYEKKKVNTSKGGKAAPAAPMQQSVPNSAFLTDGASRIDLPEAMRTKMESAYGTDLSAVKVYQSQKVADGGAEAVTMGNTIAFAPGKFDMTSQSGQALLGHEMSHVVSQSRGEVQGSGVVDNAALEARADKEGAMAAAGEQVYNGPVSAPLSSASPVGLAGPMQCKKKDDRRINAIQKDVMAAEGSKDEDAKIANYGDEIDDNKELKNSFNYKYYKATEAMEKKKDQLSRKHGSSMGDQRLKQSKEYKKYMALQKIYDSMSDDYFSRSTSSD